MPLSFELTTQLLTWRVLLALAASSDELSGALRELRGERLLADLALWVALLGPFGLPPCPDPQDATCVRCFPLCDSFLPNASHRIASSDPRLAELLADSLSGPTPSLPALDVLIDAPELATVFQTLVSTVRAAGTLRYGARSLPAPTANAQQNRGTDHYKAVNTLRIREVVSEIFASTGSPPLSAIAREILLEGHCALQFFTVQYLLALSGDEIERDDVVQVPFPACVVQ